MGKYTITDEKELEAIAQEIISAQSEREGAHTLALSGELGAGKTAFVKALSRVLGVVEEVTSPTFVLMKTYDTHGHTLISKLIHIDAYRIVEESEMGIVDIPELALTQGALICIEWPERIPNLLPKDALQVMIESDEAGKRTISYGN